MPLNIRFKKLAGFYLFTDDLGDCRFITQKAFRHMERSLKSSGKIDLKALWGQAAGGRLTIDKMAARYARKNDFLFRGPSLHIMVMTLRCDHACVYCQASACSDKERSFDMTWPTAKKVVEMIFRSPSPMVTIEFQGGEPLLNFDVIKKVISFAKRLNRSAKKDLRFTVVSNLTFMDKSKLDFLVRKGVGLCTSLDGPAGLHNAQRVSRYKGQDTYQNVVRWIKHIHALGKQEKGRIGIGALTTITKRSLQYPRKIIDAYVKLGLNAVYLRDVAPFGLFRKKAGVRHPYTVAQFMRFYRDAFEHILALNRSGVFFVELAAQVFLRKILTGVDPNHMDMRSPCGAGIGQIAYNYNGDVYTCDEGRMFAAASADQTFRMGNVHENSYAQLIDNPVVKMLCTASCLEGLPRCSSCVYKPFCGVCPAYNYSLHGQFYDNTGRNFRCRLHEGMLDYLFKKLNSPDRGILEKWIKR